MVRMTRRAGGLLALIVLVSITAVAGPAGAQSIQPRIVGGSAVPITDHPWQVAVLVDDSGGFSQFCGGAILDATHVVTAGHCTDLGWGLLLPEEVRVLAGNAEWPVVVPEEQYVGVSAVTPIAAYVPDFENDAAILDARHAADVRRAERPAGGPDRLRGHRRRPPGHAADRERLGLHEPERRGYGLAPGGPGEGGRRCSMCEFLCAGGDHRHNDALRGRRGKGLLQR